jgi:hypothetical protein
MKEEQHAIKQLCVIRKINAKLRFSFIYNRSENVTVVLKALCVIQGKGNPASQIQS